MSPEGEISEEAYGGELVKVAFARDAVEAGMIKGLLENAGIPVLLLPAGMNVDGPQLGFGLLPDGMGGGPQRVMVHGNRAERARALLAETLVADEDEEMPEIADAAYLEDAGGSKPRGYGLAGAYARAYLSAIGFFAVAVVVFLILRGP